MPSLLKNGGADVLQFEGSREGSSVIVAYRHRGSKQGGTLRLSVRGVQQLRRFLGDAARQAELDELPATLLVNGEVINSVK